MPSQQKEFASESLIHEPLKILMIAPTPFFSDRGCHVRIYEEARALTALGHEVCIATYHLGRDMAGIPTVRIPAVPWYKKLTAGPSRHKPYLDILLFFRALSTARRFRPNVIHAHLHEGAFIGLFLKKMLRVPLLFDCQGSLTEEMIDHGFIRRGALIYRLFHCLEKIINKGADFIITSSRRGMDDLQVSWGIRADKVDALTDGVDISRFHPFPRDEARRELDLPADVPVVVYLGVLNSYQGIDILLESIKILREKGTAPHFLIMGFPVEVYRKKAEALGLGECITFTGRIDYEKAPLYLCAGDVAVSPKISLTEANGKLFNYMACGLPTVAFENPVNREILGDTGVYARRGDPADLAASIDGLLRDKGRSATLAARVREKAAKEHSWAVRGEILVEIYRRIKKTACQ